MSEMFIESLRRRVGALNTLWQRAAADMTPEQINTPVVAGALPLAFYFLHYVPGQDEAVSQMLLGETPLCERAGWAEQTGAVGEADTGTPGEQARQVRIGHLDAWRAYQAEVFARTERALAALTEEQLARVVIPAIPEAMAATFVARLVGVGNPLRTLDALEAFVYQHGLRHIGEVEFARGLLGLGGLTA